MSNPPPWRRSPCAFMNANAQFTNYHNIPIRHTKLGVSTFRRICMRSHERKCAAKCAPFSDLFRTRYVTQSAKKIHSSHATKTAISPQSPTKIHHFPHKNHYQLITIPPLTHYPILVINFPTTNTNTRPTPNFLFLFQSYPKFFAYILQKTHTPADPNPKSQIIKSKSRAATILVRTLGV